MNISVSYDGLNAAKEALKWANKGANVLGAKLKIETTLYELIEAVNQEVHPGEERLVPVIVEHILETSRSVEVGL